MAEIEKDLPDPLEDTTDQAAADPDDLIAQMAGDAIDKLIADSENAVVRPPHTPLEPAAADSTAVAGSDPKPHAADSKSPIPHQDQPEARRSPVDDVAPVEDEKASDVAVTSAELDTLFNSLHDEVAEVAEGLNLQSPAGEVVGEKAVESGSESADNIGTIESKKDEAVEAAVQADAISADDSPGLTSDIPTESANKNPAVAQSADDSDDSASLDTAMESMDQAVAGSAHDNAVHDEADSASEDVAQPIVEQVENQSDVSNPAFRADVKALLQDMNDQPTTGRMSGVVVAGLRLINAPFTKVPDEARDILGQIAIITLINALAILLYVTFFR